VKVTQGRDNELYHPKCGMPMEKTKMTLKQTISPLLFTRFAGISFSSIFKEPA